MTPAHVSPLVSQRIQLEEQVVLSVERNRPIGIVQPVGRRMEVNLRLPGCRSGIRICGGCGLLSNNERGKEGTENKRSGSRAAGQARTSI
jgi:hypothetical protein